MIFKLTLNHLYNKVNCHPKEKINNLYLKTNKICLKIIIYNNNKIIIVKDWIKNIILRMLIAPIIFKLWIVMVIILFKLMIIIKLRRIRIKNWKLMRKKF
jgi:hypothetical protein